MSNRVGFARKRALRRAAALLATGLTLAAQAPAALAQATNSGASNSAGPATDPAKLKLQVAALAVQIVATAHATTAQGGSLDKITLKSEIESTLLGVLATAGVDTATGIAALRESLKNPTLTPIEQEAIRELIRKLEQSRVLDPAALGLGLDLVPPPPFTVGGGSGYRVR